MVRIMEAENIQQTNAVYRWMHNVLLTSLTIQSSPPTIVLNGRGGATNSYVGNRSFRKLVKQYKGDYLKAKKRDKPKVAKLVVEKIRETGGRFLERFKTNNGILWVDIGDERAKEKASQALREGAPEIRRRKALSDVDSGGKNHKDKDSDGSLSATSAFDRVESDEDNKLSSSGRTQILRMNFESEKNEAVSIAVAPMVIRPSITLLCGGQINKPLAIPIDNLDEREREIYLRDFLPPNPSIQKKKLDLQTFAVVSATDSENGRKEKDEGWGAYNKVIEL